MISMCSQITGLFVLICKKKLSYSLLTNEIPNLTGSDTHGVTPGSCEIRDRQKQVDGQLSGAQVKREAFFMSTPVTPGAGPSVKCPDPSWLYYKGIPISGNKPERLQKSGVGFVFFNVLTDTPPPLSFIYITYTICLQTQSHIPTHVPTKM